MDESSEAGYQVDNGHVAPSWQRRSFLLQIARAILTISAVHFVYFQHVSTIPQLQHTNPATPHLLQTKVALSVVRIARHKISAPGL